LVTTFFLPVLEVAMASLLEKIAAHLHGFYQGKNFALWFLSKDNLISCGGSVKIAEIVKAIVDFVLSEDFHIFCRQLEGILIEVTLLVILMMGLLHILRSLLQDESDRKGK
jgi:hypothetical protein